MNKIVSFELVSYFQEYQIWKYNSSTGKFDQYECMNDSTLFYMQK